MALPVLDGNQSATTLSSVFTGGEHIVAHSVVSLGTTAISNITSAVSGSVVSVSNFPATQTIAGTVTVGQIQGYQHGPDTGGPYNADVILVGEDIFAGLSGALVVCPASRNGNVLGGNSLAGDTPLCVTGDNGGNVLVAGTVTVGNSVTIGSLPAISGTVTVGNSVTIGAMPNGSLTTRFGTPTTANTAFATSAVTNANRKYLLIQNVTTGSNVITVGIGFTPTTTQGIQLTAGAGITFESSYIPTGQIYILSSVTASNFTILEA